MSEYILDIKSLPPFIFVAQDDADALIKSQSYTKTHSPKPKQHLWRLEHKPNRQELVLIKDEA